MNDKHDKYCDFDSLNLILVVAIELDPRYKLHYVKFSYDSFLQKPSPDLHHDECEESSKKRSKEREKKAEDFVDELKDLMRRTYDGYKFFTFIDSESAITQGETV